MINRQPSRREAAARALYRAARATGLWCLLPVLCLVALIGLFTTAGFNIQETAETVLFRWDSVFANLAAFGLFALVALLVVRKRLWQCRFARALPLLLALLYLGLGVFWVFSAGARQYGEPERINLSAVTFTDGEYSHLLPEGYNYMFPFQLGFTLYIEGVYRLFGTYNTLAVSLLNAAFAAGCYLLLQRIAAALFPEGPAALLCCLLLFPSVYLVPYTTFNYGILPGLCLALGGVLCTLQYLRGRRAAPLVGAVLCSALATIVKSNYQIFAVGIAIVLAVELLGRPKPTHLLLAAALVLANLLGMRGVYALYSARAGEPIGPGVPKAAWVAMGLADDGPLAPGWYNGYTYALLPEADYDTDAAAALAADAVQERLAALAADPAYAARFFATKLASEWAEPTYGSFMATWYAVDYGGGGGWVRRFFVGGTWDRATVALLDRLQFVTLFGAALGVLLARKRLALAQLLPGIILVGGFLFFLLWEGKSQYVMPFAVLALPYAGQGYTALGEKLDAWLSRQRKPLRRTTDTPQGKEDKG